MHAHTPPFTKSATGCDAKTAYDETSKIAAAQDAKLDPISDVEAKVRTALSHLHHAQLLLKEVFPEPRARAPKWSPDWLAEQATVAGTPYLASFSPNGSRIATAAEIDNLRDLLTAEELKGFGIGDVHPLRHATLDERTPEDKL